jgi:quercetin dioxygenase-like cupin family protein
MLYIYQADNHWRIAMAMSMLDKQAASSAKTEWPKPLQEEFAREAQNHNGCVGSALVSESDKVRVWTIYLKPGQRFGFHRHVLDYFWTSVSGGRGRQHLMDGTTVEYSYKPGETRHETYGAGEYKVHDLENIGDKELVFMTVEFLASANKPLPIPQEVRNAPAA